jgi:hypothetical protein
MVNWKKIAAQLARLLMQAIGGDDVGPESDRLVKKHFPEIYKEYE